MRRYLILFIVVVLAAALVVFVVGPAGGQSTGEESPDRLRIGTVYVEDENDPNSYVEVESVPLTVFKNTQGGGAPIPDQDYALTVLADEAGGVLTFSAIGEGLRVCSAHGPSFEVSWGFGNETGFPSWEALYRREFGGDSMQHVGCGTVYDQLVRIGCGAEQWAGSGSVACSAYLRFHALVHVDEPYGNYMGPGSVEFWQWIPEDGVEPQAQMTITLPGPPIEWSKATLPSLTTWTDPDPESPVFYDLDYLAPFTEPFVAVGQFGTLLTSQDGVAWRSESSGTTYGLYDVATSGTRWVAVGHQSTILTSDDTVTWTGQSGTWEEPSLRAVATDGTTWVAVGSGGTILTSTDLVSWTPQSSGTEVVLADVATDGTTWVVVGGGGTILTSTDLTYWAPQAISPPLPVPDLALRGVATNGSQWVAVGDGPTIVVSYDSFNWVPKAVPIGYFTVLTGVATDGVQWVVVGAEGNVVTSPDGEAWTSQFSGTSHELSGITR